MRRYSARVQCHTYPSRATILRQWAGDDGVSVSKYFRDIISAHVQKKSGFVEQPPQKPQKPAPLYPRLQGLGYVYLIRCGTSYKIGRAVDVVRRVSVMSLPMRPEIIAAKCCPDYGSLEKQLHKRFSGSRVYGEWFNFSDEQLEDVKKQFE